MARSQCRISVTLVWQLFSTWAFVRLKDSGIILLLAKLLVLLKTARVDVVTQDGLYKAVNIIATCNRNFCNPKKKSKLLKEETDFCEPQLL